MTLAGPLGGCFGFSPFEWHIFMPKCDFFENYTSYTPAERPRDYVGLFLRVTLVPFEVFVPLTGSF